MQVFRLPSLPATPERNSLYFIGSDGVGLCRAYVSGHTGNINEIEGVTNEADVQALLAASRYDHPQPTPATTWTVNHNLGRPASATVYSVGGLELEAEVVTVSLNQIQVLFTIATAGSAVIT